MPLRVTFTSTEQPIGLVQNGGEETEVLTMREVHPPLMTHSHALSPISQTFITHRAQSRFDGGQHNVQ